MPCRDTLGTGDHFTRMLVLLSAGTSVIVGEADGSKKKKGN